MTTRTRTVAAAIALAAMAQAARAAEPGVVTAVGTATGSYRPDVLRVKVLLSADGKDTREAVAALTAKRDAIRTALTDAGASAVTFTPPTTGGPTMTPQQRQMAAIMAMQRNNRKAPATQPSGVTVSTTVSADCPLPGDGTDDDALVAAMGAEDKLKAALARATPKRALTPEEQEASEEAAASDQNPMQPPAPKPGEPDFTFVRKLSDAERLKLTTDALALAHAEADRVAHASGATLGAVREVATRVGGAADPDNPYAALIQAETGGGGAGAVTIGEATSPQPGPVSYAEQVTVKYALGS